MPARPPPRSSPRALPDGLAVVAWMSGALVSFSASAVAVRELSGALPLFDALAARSAVGVTLAFGIALAGGHLGALAPRRMVLHAGRNTVHFLATFAWALGLTLMPMATVFALEFTTPAWVTVLAALVLRERLTLPRLGAVVLGIAGVATILRPGAGLFDPSALIVLAAALGFAITTVTTKILTRTEPVLAILFWMGALQLPLNLVAGRLFPGVPQHAFGLHEGLALAALCLGGFASHWCVTNAYQRGDAIVVMPLDCLRIPLIALVGWWAYGERVDPFLFLGAALIVGGILWMLTAEARRRPAR